MHKIINGDSLSILDTIDDKGVDAIVTDPPYGVSFKYRTGKEQASTPEEYWTWFKPYYYKMLSKVRDGGFVCIWQSQKYLKYLWDWYGDDIHIYSSARSWVQLRKTPINYSWDPIVMFYKSGAPPLRPEKPRRNLDHFVSANSKYFRFPVDHPCPRPLDQVVEIVSNFVTQKAIVLDPFGGSGTTALACKLMDRQSITIEIDEEYCRQIDARVHNVAVAGKLF